MAEQSGGGGGYALNPFAAASAGAAPGAGVPVPPVSKTRAYADGLRNYAGKSVNEMAATTTPTMAAHLSQDPTFGVAGGEDSAGSGDFLEAYRSLKDDPKVPTNQKLDIDRIWRATPNAAIFKSGYEHNPYVAARAEELRAARMPQPSNAYGRLRGHSDGD